MTLASINPRPNLNPSCGRQIKYVQSHCYLGIQISNTLNWIAQCNSIARKVQQTFLSLREIYINAQPTLSL